MGKVEGKEGREGGKEGREGWKEGREGGRGRKGETEGKEGEGRSNVLLVGDSGDVCDRVVCFAASLCSPDLLLPQVDTVKRLCIKNLPNVLVIQFRRFDYEQERSG